MSDTITAGQLVHEQCGNMIGGECVYHISGVCEVEQGKRCGWFESRIIPLAKTTNADLARIQSGVGDYLARILHAPAQAGRKCACGAEMGPRKRHCPDCAKARRRATFRKSALRSRCQQLPESPSSQVVAGQGLEICTLPHTKGDSPAGLPGTPSVDTEVSK